MDKTQALVEKVMICGRHKRRKMFLIASNGRVLDVEKHSRESGCDLIDLLSRSLPRDAKESHERSQSE
jgi:hypothetical protein